MSIGHSLRQRKKMSDMIDFDKGIGLAGHSFGGATKVITYVGRRQM